MRDAETISINSEAEVEQLFEQIKNGPPFAERIKFKTVELSDKLLELLEISKVQFEEKYFYYNQELSLHISESFQNYYWISTMGLVPARGRGSLDINKYVRACCSQYIVIKLLLEKALEVCQDESVYDIDGFYFGYIERLNLAIEQNILFYLELFGKAYLSINNVEPVHEHKIGELYEKVRKTMFSLGQNNSLFHAAMLNELQPLVMYFNTIPKFKEQYVKYDDNTNDTTVLRFEKSALNEFLELFALCNDFIFSSDFSESSYSHLFLEQGLYEKYMDKAKLTGDVSVKAKKFSFLLDVD